MVKQRNVTAMPRLRFPEFRSMDAWRKVPLEQIAERRSTKNSDGRVARVLTNSAEFGVLDQRDYFDKDIATAGKVDGYFVVGKGDYVYNPRTSAIAPVGPISRNNLGEGVMSPLYTVFRFSEDQTDFYEHYFRSTGWHSYLRSAASSGARHDRMSITTGAFMRMPVPVPAPEEQQKIADCLTSLDEVIAAQGRKVEALKAHKRGLMQQLFPREGETRPRLRFPDFRDAPSWNFSLLQELEDRNWIELGRGNVISHDDMRANPGLNPVYSSSVINQGLMGTYAQHMFDEELISWSIDGGGHFFHRPRHKFSVTNVSGFMRLLSSEIVCHFLAYQLQTLHASHTFDYQQKAHPSVIRALYRVGLPSHGEQQRIADCLSSLDCQISTESRQLAALKTHKQGLMQQLFPAPAEG